MTLLSDSYFVRCLLFFSRFKMRDTEYWAVVEFVFPNMNKYGNFTHLSVLLPILPVHVCIQLWVQKGQISHLHTFLEHRRVVDGNTAQGLWFSNKGSWISGLRMKIQMVCNVCFCLSFISKIFVYLFEKPSGLANVNGSILTALYQLGRVCVREREDFMNSTS